jgi:hypothetical protein
LRYVIIGKEEVFISIIVDLGHRWNTPDCSTVNSRRRFLENCINQFNDTFMNTTDLLPINYDERKSLEKSFLYENCSEKLSKLRIVSPAQEYFQ